MKLPSNDVRIGLCQMTSTDDIEANIEQLFARLNAFEDPSRLAVIVFPENSLFLKVGKDTPVRAFDLSEPVFTDIQKFCRKKRTSVLLGSLPLQENSFVSNATVFITADGPAKAVYRKIHLFDVDVEGAPPVRESDQFRHGGEPHMLKIQDWLWGLSICYDLRFPELYLNYARGGAHVLFIPSAFLVPTGSAHWHILLRARAIESQCFVVAPAQGGEHKSATGQTRKTYGHSLCVSPWGEILCELSDEKPVAEVELTVKSLHKVRQQIPMTQHRRLR